jgi:hypothetical protein
MRYHVLFIDGPLHGQWRDQPDLRPVYAMEPEPAVSITTGIIDGAPLMPHLKQVVYHMRRYAVLGRVFTIGTLESGEVATLYQLQELAKALLSLHALANSEPVE